MKKTWSALLALLALLALVGCSASSPNIAASESTAAAQASPSTSAPTMTAALTAMTMATTLQHAIPEITQLTQITETNDPNNLIGRPGKYTDAVTIYDNRTSCPSLGATCGATIEMWGSPADAQSRSDYIQTTLKASPALGTEYDYVNGIFVLRVSGALTPTEASEYQASFSAAG